MGCQRNKGNIIPKSFMQEKSQKTNTVSLNTCQRICMQIVHIIFMYHPPSSHIRSRILCTKAHTHIPDVLNKHLSISILLWLYHTCSIISISFRNEYFTWLVQHAHAILTLLSKYTIFGEQTENESLQKNAQSTQRVSIMRLLWLLLVIVLSSLDCAFSSEALSL